MKIMMRRRAPAAASRSQRFTSARCPYSFHAPPLALSAVPAGVSRAKDASFGENRGGFAGDGIGEDADEDFFFMALRSVDVENHRDFPERAIREPLQRAALVFVLFVAGAS